MSQMKVFCRQRISESNCVRKNTADTDILITCRNDHRKIMQPIRIRKESATRMKWNQHSQIR